MNKVLMRVCLGALMFFSVPGLSLAGDDLKLGYLDMQKAIQATSEGKSARGELEKIFNSRKTDLKKVEDDLQTKQEDFKKKEMVLSDEVKARKQTELQQDFLKYQEQLQKSQMEIQKKEAELTKPIIDGLRKTIDEIAKTEKYTMILEKSQQGIVWAKSEIDITDKVVAEYEKTKKAKK